MARKTAEVLGELKHLIYQPGFVYSLCLILFEDFHLDLNKIHEVDHRSRLSVKECSLILGFLVQADIDLSFPASPEETFFRKEETYRLMQELHLSLIAPQMGKFGELMERNQRGEKISDKREERRDFFLKDGGILEPMFYSGDGVYDFQYLEYLDRKYKYDLDWLREHRGFEIDTVREIVAAIKKLSYVKSDQVKKVNIKEVFPDMAATARKQLKKKYDKQKIAEIERQQLVALSFYRYEALFPAAGMTSGEEGWKVFYQNLLELFIIRPSDLEGIAAADVSRFLKNFSFKPGGNAAFEGPGHYNVLNSRPLIDLGEERYMLPIGYLLPEAVYESPFYWMTDDKTYLSKLAKHRGDVGEEIAYDYLSQVFGAANTYRSVLVESQKGKAATDIDVLCILGNKALCVQVKSKKLTINAKRGDFDQLTKDFKGAVQDAYDQGLISREAVLKREARFLGSDGMEISLPEEVNEVFILGLTTENYPTLAHQVHLMLEKGQDDPYPLFISAFDLELLAHYLKDPYDFLYYIRQRTRLMDYFRADEELVYLGYHLDRKLWLLEGADMVSLESDYAKLIDRNFYPYKTGVSHLLPEKDDPIQNRWKDPKFDQFIASVKRAGHPAATDIILHMLDWSGQARTDIVDHLFKTKSNARHKGETQTLATPPTEGFGLSYVVTNNFDPQELEARMVGYAQLRKYVCKADIWLSLGAYADTGNLIDGLVYLTEPWQHDHELEATYQEEIALMRKSRVTPINTKVKYGRNAPCPCHSGKKYKHCCMPR